MNKRFCNLNGYLLINLVLVGAVLIGVWRNQPLVDTNIRLTSLLLLLIIINSKSRLKPVVGLMCVPNTAPRQAFFLNTWSRRM